MPVHRFILFMHTAYEKSVTELRLHEYFFGMDPS